MGVEQSAIGPNGWVNGTSIQSGTQNTFNAMQNFGTGAFNIGQAFADFVNSVTSLHASAWILTIFIVLIVVIVLAKIGWEGLKLIGYVVLGGVILIILFVILRALGLVTG